MTAMVTHPTKPLFMVAGQGGRLQTWDLLNRTLIKTHQLPTPTPVTCMTFSHDGMVLALGSATGVVRLCKEPDCELIADFRPLKQVRRPAPLLSLALAQLLTQASASKLFTCFLTHAITLNLRGQQNCQFLMCQSTCITSYNDEMSASSLVQRLMFECDTSCVGSCEQHNSHFAGVPFCHTAQPFHTK